MILFKNFFFLYILIFFFKSNIIFSNEIATINIEYILENNLVYSKYIDDLSIIKSKIDKLLLDEEQKLLSEKKEIEDLSNILKSEEIDNKILLYNQNVNNFSLKVDSINKLINKNIEDNKMIIMKIIYEISKNISIENNYLFILSEQNYFIASEKIDISDIIINRLKEKNLNFYLIDLDKIL